MFLALIVVSSIVSGWMTRPEIAALVIPAIFPPTAIAICMALKLPRSWLPFNAVAALAAITVGNVLAGFPLTYGMAYAMADIAQMIVVYLLLTRTPDHKAHLRTWRDLLRFAGAILVGAVVAALAGTTVDLLLLPSPDLNSLTFAFGISVATNLLILPLAMEREAGPDRPFGLESIGLGIVCALAVFLLFGTNAAVSLVPIVVPILMIATVRFGTTVAHTMMLLLGAFSSSATIFGVGPFVSDVRGGLILAGLQVFMVCTTVAVIVLSITLAGERRAQARAITQEVGVARLIESAESTAFIAADDAGRLTLFSPGAERLLGYRAEEVLGLKSFTRFHDPDEMLVRARELGVAPGFAVLTREVDSGAPYETRDWTYVCKDGTRKPVSVSMTQIRDEFEHPMGYLGIVRDMSEWRAAESALRLALDREKEANVLMREASSAKTDFVNNVSHELRTPLASIMGYLELLDDEMVGPITVPQRELLGRIDRNSQRLMAMIQDLLTLGEMDDGHFTLSAEDVDLREVIERAVSLSIVQRGDLPSNVDVDLPRVPVIVEADGDHLGRMMLNLLSNAFKFTPPDGRVRVVVSSSDTDATIKVQDTGFGIPHDEQPRIFQRFFRASSARDAEMRGSGLGLSVVDEIVRAHGGTIDVQSMPGGGSTFTVTLPRVQAAEVPRRRVRGVER